MVFFAITPSGCGKLPTVARTEATGGEILVGCSAAMSGGAAALGLQLTQGSQSYLDLINARGGVHGRKIILRCYDDAYDPKLALANTLRLINEDKVFVLMDYVGTPTARAVLPTINEAGIPILGLFSGAEFLRTPFQPYVYNVRASYFDEAEAMIDHCVDGNKKRVAVFMQDDSFGQAVLAGAQVALARHNLDIVTIGRYTRGSLPDPVEVTKIVAAKPDAVIMAGTYEPLAQFVIMAKKAGLADIEFATVSFVGPQAFARELLKHGSDAANSVLVTQVVPSPDGDSTAAVEFRAAYKKAFPAESVSYTALEGYLNAVILVEGLRRCGVSCDRPGFQKALESMHDFDAGVSLKSRIYADNHSFFSSVFLSKMQGDRFTIFEPSR